MAILYLAGFKAGLFLLLWVLFTLLPSLVILFSKMPPIGERYLYLPSVGFTIFLAIILAGIKRREIFIVSVLAIISLYAFSTHERLKAWQDDLTLWEDTAAKNPALATAHTNYARALIAKKEYEKGREELLVALKQKISREQASVTYDLLGVIEMKQNNPIKAEALFQDAMKANPQNILTLNNLGVLYLRMSESDTYKNDKDALLEKAVHTFEKILERSPNFIQPRYNLGLCYMKKENYGKAEQYFNEVIELDPLSEFTDNAIQFLMFIEIDKIKAKRRLELKMP